MKRQRFQQMSVVALTALWLCSPTVFATGHAQETKASVSSARISAVEAADLFVRGAAIIVDVREPELYRRGHIPGARLAPPDQWREVALELKGSAKPVITYCSCPREETSLRAAARFEQLGVPNVRALLGGYEEWAASGRPVVKPEAIAAGNVTPERTTQQPASRESWQRVPDIFAAMNLANGAHVADVGAGDGFFTTRLAKAVGPTGRVYAVDISQSALDRLKRRVAEEGLQNVEVILGTADDPRLPAGALDAVLIVNAYHEMREHQSMLAAIKRALKPEGRLVILESVMAGQAGTSRESQESRHQLAPQYLQRDVIDAGFFIARFEDGFTRRGGNHPEYLLAVSPVPPPSAAPPDHIHGGMADEQSRRPDDVVAALQLRPGMTVVDLGAGSGIFTRRFARAVGPGGRAIALDIDRSAVEAIKQEAKSLGLPNYEARVVAADDPAIEPGTADVIFLSNTYHHLDNRVVYARKLRAGLKPGGRLVIVDFAAGPGMRGMPDHPDRARVERELADAGFRLVKSHEFLTGQFFLEFEGSL
jgi:ubiquinone/menaquinone biosynthesis C-methylase UbiE/rhodanese-related sulfurtransferase